MRGFFGIFSLLFLTLFSANCIAQEIAVEPNKGYFLDDTVHAKFGDVFTENDPFGRRTFLQSVIKSAGLTKLHIEKPEFFLVQLNVDTQGKSTKIKMLRTGNAQITKLLIAAIEKSPAWKPYKKDGTQVETVEQLAFVLLPPKVEGGEVRVASSVAPVYSKDGISGFISMVDAKVKDSNWRYANANVLKKRLRLRIKFTVHPSGTMTYEILNNSNEQLDKAIYKLFTKVEEWQPGIFVSRLCPYSFELPIDIAAWNERLEGEKINKQAPQKKTQFQLEMQRRYQDRQSQR